MITNQLLYQLSYASLLLKYDFHEPESIVLIPGVSQLFRSQNRFDLNRVGTGPDVSGIAGGVNIRDTDARGYQDRHDDLTHPPESGYTGASQ